MSKQLVSVERGSWINRETGEIIEAETITRETTDSGFQKIWLMHILEAIEEVGNAKIQVLFWMLKSADVNNRVHGTYEEIAKGSKVSVSTVARLMTTLQKCDIVRREYGGVWLLNPAIVFKGHHKKRMDVLIRYHEPKQLELPFEEKEIKNIKPKKEDVIKIQRFSNEQYHENSTSGWT